MENKNLIILFGLAVILILAGIITAMSLNDNSNKNNTTNESLNLTTNDNENFTDNSTSKETQSNDKSSKSSTSLDVEEQEFEYTRDQPTKNVDGVDYKLMYGEDNKPTHWQSTDGQNTELPLKKNSKRSSSNSYSTSFTDSSE